MQSLSRYGRSPPRSGRDFFGPGTSFFFFSCATCRYILKDAQTVTGLPLLNGKEITPLAWCITLTIQFMPLGERRA